MDNCYNESLKCCPYVGVYLTDLVFIDENKNYVDGKINFQKIILLYNAMFNVLRFQNKPYNVSIILMMIEAFR